MTKICLISMLIILASCSNRVQENKYASADSVANVIEDKCFYDFIYDFMTQKDFQLSRVKVERWDYNNYFADKDYTMHFYPSFSLPESEFSKDLLKIKFMTIIDTKDETVTMIKFIKEGNKWFLSGTKSEEFMADTVIDIESFLYKFSTDKTFMRNHIRFPLKYTFADPDKDYADTTEYLDSNSDLKYDFFEKGNLMYFHDDPKINSDKIMIFLRGIDNGINSFYFFEKQNNTWVLVEESDYST